MTFPLESLYNWYRDIVANPKYRWWVIGGTLLYVLSPIDIIPDVFPIIGQIDDAVVITLLATEIASLLKDRNANMKQKRSDQAAAAQSVADPSAQSVDVNAVEVG
ncbi:MAG: YkvA family protein [Cyanobacteria bacterium]|nr:YkvA family protein [Cyanobacteriota bacterium]